ncbi:MAG: endonuclease/exonuclease/phosphatase family protein [Pyramidobacter sp.]
MKRTLRRLFAGLLAALCLALPAAALTIGTFNIEYFSVFGKKRYVPSDLDELAASIRASGADVLALQEIEGDATMRFFVTRWLPGWKYVGNDTSGRQDLYFLWNSEKVALQSRPQVYFANLSGTFAGRKYRLFDRPPLSAVFRDESTGKTYTLVAVHLKSNATGSGKDREQARRYNYAKRSAQIQKLNALAARAEGPTFILGDYNDVHPEREVNYPLLGLKKGFSYDNMKSNLDYIGFVNIDESRLGPAREQETRIKRRSTRRKDHPDHDIVTVEILD